MMVNHPTSSPLRDHTHLERHARVLETLSQINGCRYRSLVLARTLLILAPLIPLLMVPLLVLPCLPPPTGSPWWWPSPVTLAGLLPWALGAVVVAGLLALITTSRPTLGSTARLLDHTGGLEGRLEALVEADPERMGVLFPVLLGQGEELLGGLGGGRGRDRGGRRAYPPWMEPFQGRIRGRVVKAAVIGLAPAVFLVLLTGVLGVTMGPAPRATGGGGGAGWGHTWCGALAHLGVLPSEQAATKDSLPPPVLVHAGEESGAGQGDDGEGDDGEGLKAPPGREPTGAHEADSQAHQVNGGGSDQEQGGPASGDSESDREQASPNRASTTTGEDDGEPAPHHGGGGEQEYLPGGGNQMPEGLLGGGRGEGSNEGEPPGGEAPPIPQGQPVGADEPEGEPGHRVGAPGGGITHMARERRKGLGARRQPQLDYLPPRYHQVIHTYLNTVNGEGGSD